MGTKTDKQDEILRAKREVLTEVRSKMSHWEDCLTGKITGYEMSARKWNALCKKYSLKEASVEVVEPPETSDTDHETKKNFGNWDLDCLADLLNQKDEKIRELELLLKAKDKMKTQSIKGVEKLKQENQKLKQSQNSKVIEVLEKAKKFVNENAGNSDELTFANWICERFIDKEITELRGGENG